MKVNIKEIVTVILVIGEVRKNTQRLSIKIVSKRSCTKDYLGARTCDSGQWL